MALIPIDNVANGSDETVNQRIARYRKLMGLNQAELAKRIGMKPSTYSQMERCGNITTQRLMDIAFVLRVDANILLSGEQEGVVVDNNGALKFHAPTVVNPVPPTNSGGDLDIGLILTNKEESLVKLYRDFTKEERDEIDRYLDEQYKKSKDKKKKR